MKTINLLTISAAIALTSLAFSAGCSAPPVPDFEEDEEEITATKKKKKSSDDDEEESSSKSKSSSSKNPRPTTDNLPDEDLPPGEEFPGDQLPPGAEDQAEACFFDCIAGNPTAQQIDAQLGACYEQCSETDNACLLRCDQLMDQLCSRAPSACDLLFQCFDQCFPE